MCDGLRMGHAMSPYYPWALLQYQYISFIVLLCSRLGVYFTARLYSQYYYTDTDSPLKPLTDRLDIRNSCVVYPLHTVNTMSKCLQRVFYISNVSYCMLLTTYEWR